MLPIKHTQDHPTLEQVQGLFNQWRSNKTRRDPIPPVLWDAAVSLAEQYSIKKIARCLNLDYNKLKIRVRGGSCDPIPAFIECAPVLTIIEMTKPTGECMRIEGAGNVRELIREFFA